MQKSKSATVFRGLYGAVLALATVAQPMPLRGNEPEKAQNKAPVRVALFKNSDPCTSVVFLRQGEELAYGCEDGIVSLRKVKTGDLTAQYKVSEVDGVLSIASSGDGETLYAASNHTIEAWELSTQKQKWRSRYGSLDQGIISVSVSPDSKTIGAVVARYGAILVSAESGNRLATPVSANRVFTACDFSRDSKALLVTSRSKLSIHDVESEKTRSEVLADSVEFMDSAWSQDGKRLAILSKDKLVGVWDLKSAKFEHRFDGHAGIPLHVRFIDDDTVLTADNEGIVIQWSIKRKKIVQKFACATTEITGLAISPKGNRFAVSTVGGEAMIYDIVKLDR